MNEYIKPISANSIKKIKKNQKISDLKILPKKNENNKLLKKQRILDGASKIMNRKGFNESNISEIALEAGIREPIIYKYFSDKEDLLFSVVEDQMEKYLLFLKEHLTGINGIDQKFRKFIWAHLRYNDINREYITLVLLECRTNPNFYKSTAYKLIRENVRILMVILEEGCKEGIFRQDVNLQLFRDLVFGLMDFEAITCLVTKEIREAALDHEDIMKLLERILFIKFTPEISPIDKKQRILRAAIQMFAEKGYAGATISEIASLAKIADGSIYEYFQNKEDLLLSIPEERFKEHLNEIEETFYIRDSTRKLKRYIKHHFELYLIDRDFLKNYMSLILLNRRFYQSRAYESLRLYVKVLEDLVEAGVKDGSFKPDTNIRVFRNMFLGSFTHMILRWLFRSEGKSVDKMEEISEITELLADAIAVIDR
jgi:TetR/AcrR family fatty acid metabolism transcriptional regulator